MRNLRPKVTSAHVLALIALFVSLGGTVYAAATINGKSIRKGTIPANRVKADSLTGAQIDERTLATVPSAARAAQADRATEAAKAVEATRAAQATRADRATEAVRAQSAGSADVATRADTAERAAVATDADSLEGAGAAEFQIRCNDGAVKAFGTFKGVIGQNPERREPQFICLAGGLLKVEKLANNGEYRVTPEGIGRGTIAASTPGFHSVASAGLDVETAAENDYRVKVFSSESGLFLGTETFTVVIF